MKTNLKNTSLSQYYSQLQKFEGSRHLTKSKQVKKETPLSLVKNDSMHNYFSNKNLRDNEKSKVNYSRLNQEKNREKINYLKKNFENIKNNEPKSESKMSKFYSSIQNSNVNQDPLEFRRTVTIEKQNIFSSQDEQLFTNHCTKLYKIENCQNREIVEKMTKEINKRDRVYQIVETNLPQNRGKIQQNLEEFFRQHKLMAKIIEQFQQISNLQIKDMNELYYFLKSDR